MTQDELTTALNGVSKRVNEGNRVVFDGRDLHNMTGTNDSTKFLDRMAKECEIRGWFFFLMGRSVVIMKDDEPDRR